MVKEITKITKIDSSEIANSIFDSIVDVINYKVRDYLERHYDTLNDGDIDDILEDDEWWNSLLKDLIDKIKC